jgi:hypothetical protein
VPQDRSNLFCGAVCCAWHTAHTRTQGWRENGRCYRVSAERAAEEQDVRLGPVVWATTFSLGRFAARAHKKKCQGAVAAIKAEHLLVHGIVLPSPGLLHVQIAPLLLREQLVLRA